VTISPRPQADRGQHRTPPSHHDSSAGSCRLAGEELLPLDTQRRPHGAIAFAPFWFDLSASSVTGSIGPLTTALSATPPSALWIGSAGRSKTLFITLTLPDKQTWKPNLIERRIVADPVEDFLKTRRNAHLDQLLPRL